MSKLKHTLISLTNPVMNLSYGVLQQSGIKTYSGSGSVKNVGPVIGHLNCKRPLIVTDTMLVELNLLEDLIESLKKENLHYVVFDGIKPDPTTQIIDQAVELFVKEKCDSVISFGGGSSIDASKVISGLAKNRKVKNYMGMSRMMSFSLRKGTYPLLSVPTTAGTGAEVTMGAVISNSVTKEKGLVVDKNFVSKHVFLDPTLLTGLPKSITAQTAFDALAHAIEAYVSKYSTKASKNNSIDAIKKVFKYLPIALENGGDLQARNNLLIASHKAGLAIGRAHIGTVHSIGHNAGAIYGMPHGLIIAMLLPHVLKAYMDVCSSQFYELSIAMGLCEKDANVESAARKFINKVIALSELAQIPKTSEKIKNEKFDIVAEKAIHEAYMYPIPRYVNKHEIVSILKKIAE